MRMMALAALSISSCFLNFSADASDQEAPFGLFWGPVQNVPRPSMSAREENVTLLMYHHDRLPSPLHDTEEIVLEVCKKEGLQQIVWISRSLTDSEARDKYAAILAEGVRRYGKAEAGGRGIVLWRAGRTMMTQRASGPGENHIVMVSYGPPILRLAPTRTNRSLDTL